MPRDRPTPPPFEPEWLERSLDRYLTMGLVAMLVLIGGFVAYRVREPNLRSEALASQEQSYRAIGTQLQGVPGGDLGPSDREPGGGRYSRHRHVGLGARPRRHADRRTDRPGGDVPAVARCKGTERAALAHRRESRPAGRLIRVVQPTGGLRRLR